MHIDKYKDPDGGYTDEEGVFWEDAESFLQGYVLGFCCCDDPEANLKYVATILQHIDARSNTSYLLWLLSGAFIASANSLRFAYYVLNEKRLTEHGGRVPGWITEKGREFLEDVAELYEDGQP